MLAYKESENGHINVKKNSNKCFIVEIKNFRTKITLPWLTWCLSDLEIYFITQYIFNYVFKTYNTKYT